MNVFCNYVFAVENLTLHIPELATTASGGRITLWGEDGFYRSSRQSAPAVKQFSPCRSEHPNVHFNASRNTIIKSLEKWTGKNHLLSKCSICCIFALLPSLYDQALCAVLGGEHRTPKSCRGDCSFNRLQRG